MKAGERLFSYRDNTSYLLSHLWHYKTIDYIYLNDKGDKPSS